ncbi:MAG TPA: NUDIX domain-containing protein [Candidatus Corynebacterium avicola]|uniref:NUDIX domain-containing protein n=1 Tax=Candidatus Corynebacterium avicola TaxID=2838527 RepID=A0A9D1RN77_9CORY|nr:NUDIX domain-containing protein [Candidatus Corynebacterium avicola]
MGTPPFITELRESIGHAPLWLPGVTAIVVRDVAEDAPVFATPEVLLVKRADYGRWTPVCGIIEPGEEVTTAAVREVAEETGLTVEVDALIGTGAVGPVVYPNGDECSFMDTTVRCVVTGEESEPWVNDEESTEVGWFPMTQLPQMDARFRLVIADAVAQLKHPAGFRPRLGYVKRSRPVSGDIRGV